MTVQESVMSNTEKLIKPVPQGEPAITNQIIHITHHIATWNQANCPLDYKHA